MTRRKRHQLRCQCCGLLFPAAHSAAIYCSNACRQYSYQQRKREAISPVALPPAFDDDDLPFAWREHQEVAALAPFAYQGRQVRVTTDEHGVAWFVAADVCDALGIGAEQTRRLDDDEKGVSSIPTPGGQQSMTTVNEPDLYSLILGSRKPEARAFKRWVTHEVLPAIRRTGSYSTTPAPAPPLPHGVHVVAKNHRHANWLWNLAVEQHVGQALMCKIARDNRQHTNPSHIQIHLPAA